MKWRVLTTWLFLVIAGPHHLLQAWEAHYLLTYAALKEMPEIRNAPSVSAETLDTFVENEKEALSILLKKHESWAKQHIQNYPVLPTKLVFEPKRQNAVSLTKQFLESIRVNPDLSYSLFLLYPTGVSHSIHNPIPKSAIMLSSLAALSGIHVTNPPVEKISPGQLVSPLEILTSAADEPDYGLDIGLWQDNHTWYGNLYGLGKQPFGNSKVVFSSQAPFHMGFYHESRLLYAAAGFLKKCYPEYRIHLFLTLSRHALASGHPYWGYRFLGWALHYIQDLTQPYHSTLAPGVGVARLLGTNLLEMIGIKGPAQDLRELLTDRHLSLEHFEFDHIDIAKQALADVAHDKVYPAYSISYPRRIVAAESHVLTSNFDALMKKETFLNMMRAVGSHTRNMIRSALSK